MKRRFLVVLGATVTLFVLVAIFVHDNATAPPRQTTTAKPTTEQVTKTPPTTQPTVKEQPAKVFNKNQHSIDDPKSIWVVVNKKRPLPNGFMPNNLANDGLTKEASGAFYPLISGARQQAIFLTIISSYRSQATQLSTYTSYVNQSGQAKADTFSARPRHSEHQTGLAVDVGNGTCNLEVCFGTTPAGQWLANNAHKYGFVIRYPKGKEPITGYQYEPWHLRYVGKDLAQELYKKAQTLEEFFGLPAAPSY